MAKRIGHYTKRPQCAGLHYTSSVGNKNIRSSDNCPNESSHTSNPWIFFLGHAEGPVKWCSAVGQVQIKSQWQLIKKRCPCMCKTATKAMIVICECQPAQLGSKSDKLCDNSSYDNSVWQSITTSIPVSFQTHFNILNPIKHLPSEHHRNNHPTTPSYTCACMSPNKEVTMVSDRYFLFGVSAWIGKQ